MPSILILFSVRFPCKYLGIYSAFILSHTLKTEDPKLLRFGTYFIFPPNCNRNSNNKQWRVLHLKINAYGFWLTFSMRQPSWWCVGLFYQTSEESFPCKSVAPDLKHLFWCIQIIYDICRHEQLSISYWSYGSQTWPIKWNAVSSKQWSYRYSYMDAQYGR